MTDTILIQPELSNVKKELYDKLDKDKIQINWNKNPVQMKLFLSFLKVDVVRIADHLGSSTGWTLYENEKLKLMIKGGIVRGIDYLDSLQYGTKLSNPYNDYVNPFYLFAILSKEGQAFFVDYYKEDIDSIINKHKASIEYSEQMLMRARNTLDEIISEAKRLRTI